MKKLLNSIISSTLAILISLSMVSCANSEQGRKPIKSSDVDIWGCSFTEKVLRDLPASDYEDIKTDATIDIFMAKNEYESGQIVITPKVKVSEYNVTVSDLKLVGGDDCISGDNLQIRKAKYIQVVKNTSLNGAPMGYYPDAMLPFDSAVEYEENYINANENQSIYLTVQTDLDQTPGIYVGDMTIDFKDFVQNVPITVQVMDITVSEEPHAKNCYLATWVSGHGELDTTQGLRDAYYQALIDYRLAPSLILKENDQSDEMIQFYVDKAYEWLSNPKCSNVGIPYAESSEPYNGKYYNCINRTIFEKYLVRFMEKSLETGVNLMKKLVFYNAIIDEAFLMERPMDQVRLNYKIMNNTVSKVAETYENKTVSNEDFKDEIIDSLKKLPLILTCEYSQEYIEDCAEDEYINTYCPLYQHYDSETDRLNYQREEVVEQWWYGCNFPRDPYPSTHTDVTDTVPLRVLGWMQAEFGIVGNLNWAVDYYVTSGSESRDSFVEDYYGENADRTKGEGYGAANGDGYMFYPGGQYGLDKPVGSLRLEAIRDGLEEYEIIYALKEKYAEFGFSADVLMKNLGETLHSGAQVICDSNEYEQIRKKLYALAEAANSQASLCLVDSTDLGNGQVENKIFAKDGVELKNHGVLLTNGVPVAGGKLYTIITKLENDNNSLNITWSVGGKEYSYSQNLGGKTVYFGAKDLVNNFTSDVTNITNTIVSGDIFGKSINLLKLCADAVESGQQRIMFENNYFSQIDGKVSKLTFVVYNGNSEEDVKISLYTKHAKSAYEMNAEYTLLPGERKLIDVSLTNVSWTKKGKLNSVRFVLDEGKPSSNKTLYVESFLVYYK